MAQKFTTGITVRDLASAASDAVAISVDGDTNDRIKFEAGGKIVWGGGASAGDVNLYRSATDLLKTDDAFQASGVITLTTDGAPVAALPDGALAVDTTNEVLYVRANGAWVIASGGGGASVTTSDGPPLDPASGDLWYETDTGSMFVYYDDGASQQWVEVGTAGVIAMTTSSTAPTTPSNGDLWFDTDTARTYVYYDDGSSSQWVEVGAASAAASGQDGYIQFATGGTFNSASSLVWDNANSELEVTGTVVADNVTTSGTTATTSLTVDSQYVTPYTGRRNLLYNGAMQVWQRSTNATTTSNDAYASMDRWRNRTGGAGSINVSRQTANLTGFQYCARVQRPSGQTSVATLDLIQTLETTDSIPLAGRQVTYSFYARKGADYSPTDSLLHVYLTSGQGTDQYWFSFTSPSVLVNNDTASLTSSWQRFTFTATVPSSATQVYAMIVMRPTGTAGTNDYYEVTGVQLELGDKATPFEHRSYGEELALCQRYYYRTGESGQATSLLVGNIEAASAAGLGGGPHPVTMRATPTVTLGSNVAFYSTSTSTRATSISINRSTNTTSSLYVNIVGGGATLGQACVLYDGGAEGWIEYSSEL